MKRSDATLFVVGWAASAATAGVISFEPAEMEVVVGDPRNSARTFEVAVSSVTRGSFDAIDIVIGSEAVPLTGFTYAPGFEEATVFQGPPVPHGYYTYDLGIGGFTLDPITPPMTLGTLTVDASGLAPGVYTVMVDSEEDLDYSALSLGRNAEPVSGTAALRVLAGAGTDTGGDGTADNDPNTSPEEPQDTPGSGEDGVGDNTASDDDNEGVDDPQDVSPDDSGESTDTDGDGTDDNADGEEVDDTLPDDPDESVDADSDGANESADTGGDGIGDNASPDESDGGTGPNVGGRMCGAGMLGGALFALLGLATVRLRTRWEG